MTKEFLEEKIKNKVESELDSEWHQLIADLTRKTSEILMGETGYTFGYESLLKPIFEKQKEACVKRRVNKTINNILARLEEIRPLFLD